MFLLLMIVADWLTIRQVERQAPSNPKVAARSLSGFIAIRSFSKVRSQAA
jgi:hypothetical protein